MCFIVLGPVDEKTTRKSAQRRAASRSEAVGALQDRLCGDGVLFISTECSGGVWFD